MGHVTIPLVEIVRRCSYYHNQELWYPISPQDDEKVSGELLIKIEILSPSLFALSSSLLLLLNSSSNNPKEKEKEKDGDIALALFSHQHIQHTIQNQNHNSSPTLSSPSISSPGSSGAPSNSGAPSADDAVECKIDWEKNSMTKQQPATMGRNSGWTVSNVLRTVRGSSGEGSGTYARME